MCCMYQNFVAYLLNHSTKCNDIIWCIIEKRFLILQQSFVLLLSLPHRSVSLAPKQHPGRLQNRYCDLQCSVIRHTFVN